MLSHTAGLGDGLGFGDYSINGALPTLEESLAAPRASRTDSNPSATESAVVIEVTAPPGEQWRYSGGGYLILELIIEEVTGISFADYMQQAVFEPLSMTRSGYDFIAHYENNAGSYTANGERAESYQYAAKAATGMVASADDLSRFVKAHLDTPRGTTVGELAVQEPSTVSDASKLAPLALESLNAMRAPHARTLGADVWGLGTMLYAPAGATDFIFGHDGGNDPAINTAVRINPHTGAALIVLLTGHPSLATRIGSDWVLWQTGYPDVLAVEAVFASMGWPLAVGCILIFLFAVGVRRWSRRA